MKKLISIKFTLFPILLLVINTVSFGAHISVGSGSGELIIDNAFETYGLHTGDTIFINPGIYDYLIVKNHTSQINIIGVENVIFDYKGSTLYSLLYNNKNLHFENFTFRNGTYRGLHVEGECDGMVIKNIRFRNIPDVQLFFTDLPDYDGSDSTRRDNITIDGVQVDQCSYNSIVLPWGFNSVIKNCVIDSTIGTQGVAMYLHYCKDIQVYDNTFTNINLGGTVHNGVIVMSGEGRIFNNNCINYQGDFIRGRAYSMDREGPQDVGELLVYNNFVWNSRKYGFMELQSFDDTSGVNVYGPGTVHSGRFKIYNNTAGRMRDLDYERGGSMFSLYTFARNDHEIKNNVVFFPRTDAPPEAVHSQTTAIFNMNGGSIDQVDTASNYYFTDWSQLADSVQGNLLSTSLLIDKGVSIPYFDRDYAGVTRPQGAAWDVGRMEYVSASNKIRENKANQISVIIYPNPFTQVFTIETTSVSNELNAVFSIFNALGEKIMEHNVKLLSGKNKYPIDLDGYPAGIYLLKIIKNNRLAGTVKCVKI